MCGLENFEHCQFVLSAFGSAINRLTSFEGSTDILNYEMGGVTPVRDLFPYLVEPEDRMLAGKFYDGASFHTHSTGLTRRCVSGRRPSVTIVFMSSPTTLNAHVAARGTFAFAEADAFVNWATSNYKAIRGRALGKGRPPRTTQKCDLYA